MTFSCQDENMRKYLLSMIAVFCLVLVIGTVQVSAQHFDYNEAYRIMNGNWMDTATGKNYNFVWRSQNGEECNIVNEYGYTDSRGESLIYFDYKGAVVKMYVTYYPDQGKYYGKAYMKLGSGSYSSWIDCLVKE